MIRRCNDVRLEEKVNLRGGEGSIHTYNILEKADTDGKVNLCSIMVVEPGFSIGVHPHGPDGEIYHILEGELEVSDNGELHTMKVGDSMYCGGGNSHGVTNKTDKTAKMVAIILP